MFFILCVSQTFNSLPLLLLCFSLLFDPLSPSPSLSLLPLPSSSSSLFLFDSFHYLVSFSVSIHQLFYSYILLCVLAFSIYVSSLSLSPYTFYIFSPHSLPNVFLLLSRFHIYVYLAIVILSFFLFPFKYPGLSSVLIFLYILL